MKMTKKKVLVIALIVSIIAILSLGTLAWFTDTDEATNYFYVSSEQGSDNPDFTIELFETKVDSVTGEPIPGTETDTNSYEYVSPGDELFKDPTVRNTGDYDQWVRVKVVISDYDAWIDALGQNFSFDSIFDLNNEWTYGGIEIDSTAAVNTATLTYYLNNKLVAGAQSKPVFESVTIPGQFGTGNMPIEFNIHIIAEAIQSDNTGTSALDTFTNYWDS